VQANNKQEYEGNQRPAANIMMPACKVLYTLNPDMDGDQRVHRHKSHLASPTPCLVHNYYFRRRNPKIWGVVHVGARLVGQVSLGTRSLKPHGEFHLRQGRSRPPLVGRGRKMVTAARLGFQRPTSTLTPLLLGGGLVSDGLDVGCPRPIGDWDLHVAAGLYHGYLS
jgi:hypothetical protein